MSGLERALGLWVSFGRECRRVLMRKTTRFVPASGPHMPDWTPGRSEPATAWNVVYGNRDHGGRYASDHTLHYTDDWPGLPCGDDPAPRRMPLGEDEPVVRFRRFDVPLTRGVVIGVVCRREGAIWRDAPGWDDAGSAGLSVSRSLHLFEVAVPATSGGYTPLLRLVWPEDATVCAPGVRS